MFEHGMISKLALPSATPAGPVVLDAVNEIEALTSDLSRTVWQRSPFLDIAEQT